MRLPPPSLPFREHLVLGMARRLFCLPQQTLTLCTQIRQRVLPCVFVSRKGVWKFGRIHVSCPFINGTALLTLRIGHTQAVAVRYQ